MKEGSREGQGSEGHCLLGRALDAVSVWALALGKRGQPILAQGLPPNLLSKR